MADMLRWPDEEDLNGVAIALMRLQDTYNLDTAQLARGNILGKRAAYREMTGEENNLPGATVHLDSYMTASYFLHFYQEQRCFYIPAALRSAI